MIIDMNNPSAQRLMKRYEEAVRDGLIEDEELVMIPKKKDKDRSVEILDKTTQRLVDTFEELQRRLIETTIPKKEMPIKKFDPLFGPRTVKEFEEAFGFPHNPYLPHNTVRHRY